jgi:hypothetical protein
MAVHKSRYKEHCRFGVRGERLYRILKAYGLDDFKVSVLADGLTKSQAIVMEMDMISKRRASLNEHHAVVPNRVFYKKKGLYD